MVEVILKALGLTTLDQFLLLLIPLLPLAAGLLARLCAAQRPALSAGIGITGLLGALACAAGVALSSAGTVPQAAFSWISFGGGLDIELVLRCSMPQLLFVFTTALLAAGVLLYALRERQGDPRAGVFHANITLFAGSMLLLLCADTLLLVYLAWELLGVFSLLLIAHNGTAEALRCARQAFWTTRATDMGLLLAICILFAAFGWVTISGIDVGSLAAQPVERQREALALLGAVAVLLLLAAAGKAAQWPLSFWLADAMEAPAPASALLHGATLVAAGPYLLFRVAEIFQTVPSALGLLAAVGAVSHVLAGLVALFARDAKRVLAYSTVSQLGLCIAGCGLLAEWPALAHLLPHAWGKAALFLGVGILLAGWHSAQHGHGTHGSPALRELAGTLRGRPLLLGAMVLAALPLLWGAGKDAVLAAALGRGGQTAENFNQTFGQIMPAAQWGWALAAPLLVIGVVLTAAYLTRLLLILAGPAGVTATAPASEQRGWGGAQAVVLGCAVIGLTAMLLPFIRAGEVLRPGRLEWQWEIQGASRLALLLSAICLLIGAGLGALLARPAVALRLADNPLARFFASGMYLREFWHRVAADGGMWLAALAGRTEQNVFQLGAERTGRFGRWLANRAAWVDRHVVDGLRWQACEVWWRIKRLHNRWLQNGDVQHYMLIVLVSAVILCLVVIRPLSHIFARVLERF